MYKIAVPVIIGNPRFEQDYDSMVEKCKAAGVDRIFLCVSRCVQTEEKKEQEIERMKKYVPKLKAEGFEVGTWFSSLGHGGTCEGELLQHDDITYMEDMDGKVNMDSDCPLDENFQKLFCDWVQRLAETGVEIIMIDDDFRYSIRGGRYFCCCKLHRALLEKELGEPFDADRMEAALTVGGPNKWRDAWLKVQGESLNQFAAVVRRAIDEVDPTVRMTHCAVLSTWDVDGVDSLTLAKTFAGNTKPLLRLIGAPYWAAIRAFNDIKLAAVCEYERLQQAWNEAHEVEVFCEGDVYPRPRYTVPAAYLEGMDQVMRASGTCDGMLKYMLDYTSSPDYETGYIEKHIDDKPLFEVLEKAFDGKKACGITVYEPMRTLAVSHDPGKSEDRFIPASLRFVTDNTLPVQYEAGEQAVILFGDSAELAGEEQLKHGAVLDLDAARILKRRGIDTGIIEIGDKITAETEDYLEEAETVCVVGGHWQEVQLKENARIQSMLHGNQNGRSVSAPACYTYENAQGQKFVVYAFKARTSYEERPMHGTFRGWCRAAQLRRLLPWLSGKPFDAICKPAPDLYILTKKDQDSMTVGLWNFGEDYIKQPVVWLGEEWNSISCGWGNASMDGKTVTLDRLSAFSCACFTVKR